MHTYLCVCVCLYCFSKKLQKIFTNLPRISPDCAHFFFFKAGLMNHHTITTTDENNNNSSNINNNNYTRNDGDKEKEKKRLEVPSNYKEYEATKCICYRPHKALECRQCHEYFYGRVSMQCMVHPTVSKSFQIINILFILLFVGYLSNGLSSLPVLYGPHNEHQ